MNVGIPTKYRGRLYRSRLEARWACMFDRLGWRYEYEPFDLDGWIPDFVLIGRRSVVVEVKPIVAFSKDTARKMLEASADQHGDLLLMLGSSLPVFGEPEGYQSCGVGWFANCYCDACLGRRRSPRCYFPEPQDWFGACAEFRVSSGGFDISDACEYNANCLYGEFKTYGIRGNKRRYIDEYWAEAGNEVQWRSPTHEGRL